MLESLFSYVCGQIECLVQNQIAAVGEKDLAVKSILLVGGFGSSKFLHRRLEQAYAGTKISVLQVEGS
jgi:hypothetical protein